jgi:TolB-like protein
MKHFGILVAACMAGLLFSCTSTPDLKPQENSGRDPGPAESLLIIQRAHHFVASAATVNIFVDGQMKSTIANGETGRIYIQNGDHTLQAKAPDWWAAEGQILNIDVFSEIVTYSLDIGSSIILAETNRIDSPTKDPTAKRPSGATASKRNLPGIEGTVIRASEVLIEDLPQNASIAVLSVSSGDRDMAAFAVDELEFQLVNSRRFQVVDRKTLDTIRSEQNFQLSGDVDDNSAVSIGKMLGATIVVTGAISGTGATQRLTIKALNVQTAQILTMAREPF